MRPSLKPDLVFSLCDFQRNSFRQSWRKEKQNCAQLLSDFHSLTSTAEITSGNVVASLKIALWTLLNTFRGCEPILTNLRVSLKGPTTEQDAAKFGRVAVGSQRHTYEVGNAITSFASLSLF